MNDQQNPTELPSYADLLQRTDAPPGSSWHVFGDHDELGTINLLTPERVVHAARLVTSGEVFRLDMPLDAFDPPVARHRHPVRHTMFGNGYNHRDDRLDRFYLQVSSQLDGLRHARKDGVGFYGGVPDEEIHERSARLGIGGWARHGIVGRGLLVDVDAHLRAHEGRSLDHDGGEQISADLLDDVLEAQGCRVEPGTIVLLRTGWLHRYQHQMSPAERAGVPGAIRSAGLAQDERIVAWLWDHHVAVIAADNPAVEAMPPAPNSPYLHENSFRDGLGPGMMHPVLISMLGLALGELWALDDLARACREDRRYECLVACNPLLLDAAVGSPANAVAVR